MELGPGFSDSPRRVLLRLTPGFAVTDMCTESYETNNNGRVGAGEGEAGALPGPSPSPSRPSRLSVSDSVPLIPLL